MITQGKDNLSCVYVLIGQDKLKVQSVLQRLSKRMQEYGDMSFNYDKFDAENTAMQDIINSCYQLPFSSEKRFVNLINAHLYNKDENKLLIDYINEPNESTVLTLVYDKLAKNTQLYKCINNKYKSFIIDCNPPKKYLLAESLNGIAKSHGGSINLDAAKKLIELIGDDTVKLDSEIQKLLLSNRGRAIDIQQVNLQVKKSNEIKPWDFTNAFADRNLKLALNLYRSSQKGQEFVFLNQCFKLVKELIYVQDIGKSANLNLIAKELNYETWRVKNHLRWSRNFTKEELVNILNMALECDKKMKSSSNAAFHFETFITESLRKH